MLNRDVLASTATLYQAIYDSCTGFCGISYSRDEIPEVHVMKEELEKMFEEAEPTYSKLEASFGTNYYKEYHYKGVRFYSLVDKEEYEDATF